MGSQTSLKPFCRSCRNLYPESSSLNQQLDNTYSQHFIECGAALIVSGAGPGSGPGSGPFAAAAPRCGAAPSHGPEPGPGPDPGPGPNLRKYVATKIKKCKVVVVVVVVVVLVFWRVLPSSELPEREKKITLPGTPHICWLLT